MTNSHTFKIRRVLGLTFDDKPIYEPFNAGSSITFAGAGGGKTTCVAVPAIQAMLADSTKAIFINDVKDGEIAAQVAELCIKQGRRFGVVDDFNVLGKDYPHKLSINPFSGGVSASIADSQELMFINENFMHALLNEPKDDQKNFYWRESPRNIIDLALNILYRQNHMLATLGGVAKFMNDPRMWHSAIELEADDESSPLRITALQLLEMRDSNPEHYSQHIQAALTAMKIFSSGPLYMNAKAFYAVPMKVVKRYI